MIYISVFIIYFIILLTISIYANSLSKNKQDYLIGGRKLGMLTTSISAGASDMSAWLFLGLPGAVYLFGISQIWIAIGLTLGAYLNWKLVAYGLRNMSATNNNITIPDFIVSHVEGNGGLIKIFSTITIIIFFTVYVASGFTAGGVLLSSLFNISYLSAVLLTVFFVVIYVFIGGYLAVAWTDLMQGLLMLIIIIIVPAFAINAMDFNFSNIASNIYNYNNNAFNLFYNTSIISVISLLSWGLGYFGQPHILSRFMSIKDPEQLVKARQINIFWTGIGMTFAVIVGLLSSAYFSSSPLANPEKSILSLATATAPIILVAITSVAIISAIVSTANSQLLVVASSIVEDLKLQTNVPVVLIIRVSIVIVAVAAFLLAMYSQSSILLMVGYAWAGFGASFGPLMLVLTRKVKLTNTAALSGIITGTIVVIVWKNLSGGIFDLYEILPGFICSLVVLLVVNKLTKK